MLRSLRFAGLIITMWVCTCAYAFAQAPQLVFTVAPPEQPQPNAVPQASAAIEERALAMWSGPRLTLASRWQPRPRHGPFDP